MRAVKVVVTLLIFAGLITSPGFAQTNLIVVQQSAAEPTVGMEGELDIALPIAGLITKPGDHRAPLVLRIASTQPYGTLTRYDLRYTGRVPGAHDLREYLFTAEGQPVTNLPPISITVGGLLPRPHNGWLEEQTHGAPRLFSGYRGFLIAAGVLWVAAFFVIRRIDRKPKAEAVAATVARSPTFAEQIRPLVERAAAGQLSADEKATLERMLIAYWQRRLNLADASTNHLIGQLREHPEAGELLRALEDWLHRPPGRGTVRVEEILAPYARVADEPLAEAKT